MARGKRAGTPTKPKQTGPRKGKKGQEAAPDTEVPEGEEAEQETSGPGPGHNSDLTDEQRQGLTYQYLTEWKQVLEVKKAADAGLKNKAKQIKADLGAHGLADIKLIIQLQTPEGEALLKAEIERKLRVARWEGAVAGTQFSFLEEDRTPSDDRAFAEGKRASLKGDPRKPPHDPSVPQYQAWLNGYAEGQAVIMKGFKPMPVEEKPAAPTAPVETADPVTNGGEKAWPDDVETGKVGSEDPTYTVN